MFRGELSPQQRGKVLLDKAVQATLPPERRRVILTKTLQPALPFELHEIENEGLAKAEAYLHEGYGLIGLLPHFSTGEFPRIFGALSTYGTEFRKRPLLVPIAQHHYQSTRPIARLMNIHLSPIVTEATKTEEEKRIKMGKTVPWKIRDIGAGMTTYTERAVHTLNAGGIVMLAPQTKRQATLEPFTLRAVSGLDIQVKRRVPKAAFFFIGLEVKSFETYDPEKVGGLNFLKKYEITFGEVLARNELWQRAQEHGKTLDEEAYDILLNLATDRYKPSPQPLPPAHLDFL